MEWLAFIVAAIFSLLGLGCIFLVILGLPGTWIFLGLAVLVELVDRWYLPEGHRQTFSWWLLGVCLALAIVGEVLEFFAGMLGAKKAGSSNRGMYGALIGGVIGGIMGFAIPLPIVGSLIGAVAGTFVGAILGELSSPDRYLGDSLRPAAGATVGKILGTLSKLPVALFVWILLTVAAFRL